VQGFKEKKNFFSLFHFVKRDQQQQYINSLNQVLGSRPNITVHIDSIKALSDKKAQINIYVEEKSTTSNETRRILATELCSFLNQPTPKQQMGTLNVESCVALVLPDEDQLKEYLENSPKGIDPRMWKQAKADNPDSKKLIPVPMIGFQDVSAEFYVT
jgi:nuclear pore complex protein Nup54